MNTKPMEYCRKVSPAESDRQLWHALACWVAASLYWLHMAGASHDREEAMELCGLHQLGPWPPFHANVLHPHACLCIPVLLQYLAAKDLAPADKVAFKKMLYQMW